MIRAANPLLNLLLIYSACCGLGCQRSMNGGMATGPFAPAGTAATGNNALIPVGPLTGATRVPPPATGSSSSGNGYLGTPSASNLSPGPDRSVPYGQPGGPLPPAAGFASTPPTPESTFRSTLGGMNVIDLTNHVAPPNQLAVAPAAATAYPEAVIGSGVAYVAPNVAETAARAQQPADLLRPIDQPYGAEPYAAEPAPMYRGMGTTNTQTVAPASYGYAVQPAGGFPSTDPWKSSQPSSGAVGMSGTVSSAGAGSSASMMPSTAPVSNQAPASSQGPAAQMASPSLPWRSPTAAR